MSFFDELKRRNVFKVSIAYIVVAWLLLQVADVILNNIEAPGWVFHTILLVLALGFPLISLFAWAFEMTPEGLKREHEVDRSASITPKTGRKLDFMIIGVMALALGYFAYDKFVVSAARDEALIEATAQAVETQTAAEPAEVVEQEKSIAVLPFVNMSSDPEQDYFADGISEELLNALAKVGDLKVAGRTSSFAFKGKNEDLAAIGKVLRVNHILEGSVRKSGNRIRITAQLIKVDDGFHMWSETYDRELTDIFTIQDEISAAILSQLKTQLLGIQQATIQTDTRTYDLYLLAKQRISDRNEASLEMALKLLTEAIGIDPDYAPALAQMGIAIIMLSEQNYGSQPDAETGVKSKQYIDKAIQLAPNNAEAIAAIGLYFIQYELDHQKAITELKRALAINPNLVDANNWLSIELSAIGQIQESLRLRESVFKRDPLYLPNVGNLQMEYMVMGQSEKAIEMLESLHAYLPDDANILSNTAQVYLMTGQLAKARDPFQKAHARIPEDSAKRNWYTFFLLNSQEYEMAAKVAPKQVAAITLSRLGRSEEALIVGHEALSNGLNPTWYFQALIENGRFAQLVQELESIWPDLDGFTANWSGGSGYGYDAMGFIAHAYREVGNQEKYDDAMSRFRSVLDSQLTQGANNWVFSSSRAHFAALAGDYDAAISFLETAFNQGAYLDTTSDTAWPIFKPLNGDPRYETAKAAMLERWGVEMEKIANEQS